MIHNASERIAEFFADIEIISQDESQSCAYGLEILFSSIISIIIVITIGIYGGYFAGSIIFLLVYCSLRTQIGGYHAESHLKCIGLFSSLYAVFIYSINKDVWIWNASYYMVLVLVIFIIISLAPVENANKYFSAYMREIMRKKAKYMLILFLAGFLIYKEYDFANAVFIFWALVWCALFLIMGWIKLKFLEWKVSRHV